MLPCVVFSLSVCRRDVMSHAKKLRIRCNAGARSAPWEPEQAHLCLSVERSSGERYVLGVDERRSHTKNDIYMEIRTGSIGETWGFATKKTYCRKSKSNDPPTTMAANELFVTEPAFLTTSCCVLFLHLLPD